MTIEEAFGHVIRRLRKERLLSQDELSAISSLDRGFISQIERGKQQPTLLTIFGLASALKVTTGRLLEETDLLLVFNNSKKLKCNAGSDTFEKLLKQLEEMLMTRYPSICGVETILIVDDEMFILDFLTKLFEMHGYRVLLAKDGQEAIDVYKENMSSIDIVLMDVMMPRLDGIEAHKAIFKLNPKVKIVLMSGYSQKSLAEIANLKFIQKPLSPFSLLSNVRELLEYSEGCEQPIS